MAEPLDKLEIEISSSSTDAAKKVEDLASALERLKKSASGVSEKSSKSDIQKVGKDADKSVKLSKKTVEQIEALSRATKSINSKAGHGMKELAGGLRALASVREVKIPKSLADNIANLGAAIDLIDDGISEKAIKFSSALGTLAGAGKINISTKLPDRMLDIGAAMDLISDDAIRRLDSMTASLQRLSGVDLKGLPAALREVAKSKGPTGLDMAKVDASIEKTKATIDDLKSKYEALQSVQGKGNQETQARNAAELAKVSALLEEQERLYDSLIEKKKKYADAGVGRDENLSGTGEVQTRAVEEVTQRVGLLQRALAWVRNAWSLTNAEALKATSEGTAALERMKKSLFDNATAWSKIKSVASNAFDGVKESIAAAAEQSKGLAKFLSVGVPVIGTITSLLRGIVGIFGKIVSGALQLARTLAGAAFNGVKKLASGLKSIGSHVLNYVTKPFQRAIGFIENFKKKLVSVAFYRLVRTALKMITDGFKEGIENLYYFSSLTESQFKPAMDSLASSSLYLKNSLGAMAAPLIQAVAPAVNYLIDLFVSLLNVINAVFSLLGGRTYTKALKTSAKYADDLDKSLGGGAAAAKELKRYLIGIDELNIIPDLGDSGGGGGGGDIGAGYEDMFAEVPIPDWALNIRDLIKKGKWYEAGEALADEVNKLIDKFAEKAPIWGTKIGQAIQDAIEFGLGFIRRLNIEKFAAALSTLIGNALNEINPRDLGAILASGIKSIFRFAHGFLQGYTGPEIGHYLAEVVNGWFDELRRDDGWIKAGQDLNQIILGIINGLENFILDLDIDSVVQDLKDFFGQIKWGEIWDSLVSLADTAANKVDWTKMLDSLWRFAANVLVFLRTKILGIPYEQASQPWQELENKLSDASATINWADIISGLITFVGDMVSTIKDSIPTDGWDGIWDSVKYAISTALGFDNWDDMKEQLKTKVVGLISGAFDMAGDAIYSWLSTSDSWVANAAADLFFPEKYQIDKATENLTNELKNGYTEAAQRQLDAMLSLGNLTSTEATVIAAQYGYSYSNGILSTLPAVDDAVAELTSRLPDKKTATLDVKVGDKNKKTRQEIEETWAIVNDKSPTLAASVVDSSNGQMDRVYKVWLSTNDKNVTMRATARNENPETLSGIVRDFGLLANKTVTMTANGVVDQSFNNASGIFGSISNKTVTVTMNGYQNSSFGQAKRDYQALQNKTVTVTYNAKGTAVSGSTSKRLATGGIFAGGMWHNIAGYANGGAPKRSRLFYANENGMPELIGRIGGNTAVMNNGQIVASVASGVYRAVTAAMGSVGTYFSSIANSIARIPAAMAISDEKPRFNNVFQEENMYQQVQMASGNRNGNDEVSFRGDEDNMELINALYAMGQRIIETINSKDTNIVLDGQQLGSSVTRVQNRQNRASGRSLSNAYGGA